METYDVIVNQPVVIDNVSLRHHYVIHAYNFLLLLEHELIINFCSSYMFFSSAENDICFAI